MTHHLKIALIFLKDQYQIINVTRKSKLTITTVQKRARNYSYNCPKYLSLVRIGRF